MCKWFPRNHPSQLDPKMQSLHRQHPYRRRILRVILFAQTSFQSLPFHPKMLYQTLILSHHSRALFLREALVNFEAECTSQSMVFFLQVIVLRSHSTLRSFLIPPLLFWQHLLLQVSMLLRTQYLCFYQSLSQNLFCA